MEQILKNVFQSLGIDLQVNNLAMEDVYEFLWSWRLPNHYWQLESSSAPDIIVWDFGFASQTESFEVFLRNAATGWMKDTTKIIILLTIIISNQLMLIKTTHLVSVYC